MLQLLKTGPQGDSESKQIEFSEKVKQHNTRRLGTPNDWS